MKPFLLYTLARVVLFAASFGLVWLVFGHWIEWGAVSALYTAIIAMVISSVVALLVLGSLRDDFAVQVSLRADRAKAAYEARRAAEDVDEDVDVEVDRELTADADPAPRGTTENVSDPRAGDR